MVTPNGSIDVVLLTKNSQRRLKECLVSVYKNVPVNQLIVVDGYSTDETLPIIKEFDNIYHNVKIVFDKGNRATGRQTGISLVATDWFIFVDSDVILCKDWYKKAQHYINENVGAVWGTEVWSTIKTIYNPQAFLDRNSQSF